ncbi:MAG: cell division protein ZapA [Acidobacteria bacterium]|nr:cell division protein ZapA [Acidobacteriota bacterium]
MGTSDGVITRVTILNQAYSIRSDDDPEYVRRLAGYVDQKLNQISQATPTVDSLKVAILTALNIADELFRARQTDDSDEAWLFKKLQECNLLLDDLAR